MDRHVDLPRGILAQQILARAQQCPIGGQLHLHFLSGAQREQLFQLRM